VVAVISVAFFVLLVLSVFVFLVVAVLFVLSVFLVVAVLYVIDGFIFVSGTALRADRLGAQVERTVRRQYVNWFRRNHRLPRIVAASVVFAIFVFIFRTTRFAGMI
jgi:hypothetical protein